MFKTLPTLLSFDIIPEDSYAACRGAELATTSRARVVIRNGMSFSRLSVRDKEIIFCKIGET